MQGLLEKGREKQAKGGYSSTNTGTSDEVYGLRLVVAVADDADDF
jgi:hypothetical protein